MTTDPALPPPRDAQARLVFVSGPSGAGRSTAIDVLEDLGFEAIDNLPLSLVPRLMEGDPPGRPLALGTDTRNRDWSAQALVAAMDAAAARDDLQPELLYLDCRTDILMRRFSETRRRHPLAPADRPEEGIERERDLLLAVRERATILIDTSDLNVHQFRHEMHRHFAPRGRQHLAVTVQSFSYKRGLPDGADLVLDCRFLANPHWQSELRPLDGRDPAVAGHVADDPRFDPFARRVEDLVGSLLPAFRDEGKAHLTIAFGCSGGRHRSVAMAERLAATLAQVGWHVSKRHRELERGARPAAGGTH